MIILKMIGLVFWLMVIPVGLGLLFRKSPKREHLPKKLQTAGVTLLIGYYYCLRFWRWLEFR